MKLSSSRKYVVDDEVVLYIVEKLEKLEPDVLMFNKPLNRVLFTRDSFASNIKKNSGRFWIRVRTGDVGVDGFTKTTIDYKRVVNVEDDRTERAYEMCVADYENAIQFMVSTGSTIASTQQNLRTKIKCKHNEYSYILCLDCWPWLNNKMFIKIEALDKQGYMFIGDLINTLGIENNKTKATNLKDIQGGVDGVYRQQFGFELTEVMNVSFDVSPPRREGKYFIESDGHKFIHNSNKL